MLPQACGARLPAPVLSTDQQSFPIGETAGWVIVFHRRIAPREVLAGFDARHNTPPFKPRHHPNSRIAQAELFDGKLALLTNALDLTPAEAVARYKSLADIERGFRVLKSDIEIAPVHHRLPDRIRAHPLICFLALVLYRIMRMRLKAKKHAASPRTALDLLARIQKHTAHAGNRSLHGISKTTPEQLDLFDALNLAKPV